MVLLFESVYKHFIFGETTTCFTCFFVVKNNANQYRSKVKWCLFGPLCSLLSPADASYRQ